MQQSRTTLLGLAVLAAAVLGRGPEPVNAVAPQAQQSARPNIVLLMADDQGWEETGYNGHPAVKTPVLDRLSREALRLDRMYTGGPNCSPTRGSIMTGRNNNRYGVFEPGNAIRPEEVTLAQELRRAGYATAHFGKWHLGPVMARSLTNPARMGFDEYLSHDNYYDNNPPLSLNGARPEIRKGESSRVIVDAALDYIRRHKGGSQPLFVVVWFGSPHSPYEGLPEDVALYSQVENESLRHRFAEITAMDRAIGHLRDQIREIGIRDNTLLWYMSDNGVPTDGLYQPTLKGAKRTFYENGIRVPALIEWPAVIKAARTTSVPMVSHDMMPTLLSLAGASVSTERPLDGINMRDLIHGTMAERPAPVGGFWSYPGARGEGAAGGRGAGRGGRGGGGRGAAAGARGTAVEEGGNSAVSGDSAESWMPEELLQGETPNATSPNGVRFTNFKHPVARTDFPGQAAWVGTDYKLYLPANGGPAELYNIAKDPRETTNLAASEPQTVEAMLKSLRGWQASVERSLTGADYGRR